VLPISLARVPTFHRIAVGRILESWWRCEGIIFLQETHYTTADKPVIPNFSLVGSVLSRNHGLATFVHERMEW